MRPSLVRGTSEKKLSAGWGSFARSMNLFRRASQQYGTPLQPKSSYAMLVDALLKPYEKRTKEDVDSIIQYTKDIEFFVKFNRERG